MADRRAAYILKLAPRFENSVLDVRVVTDKREVAAVAQELLDGSTENVVLVYEQCMGRTSFREKINAL